MGVGNRAIELSEDFIVTDKVKILPSKGYGIITRISESGFIFLDHNDGMPYLPTQVEKVKDIPKITAIKKGRKQNSGWYRFWCERPYTLADEGTLQDFFIEMGVAFIFTVIGLLAIVGVITLFT